MLETKYEIPAGFLRKWTLAIAFGWGVLIAIAFTMGLGGGFFGMGFMDLASSAAQLIIIAISGVLGGAIMGTIQSSILPFPKLKSRWIAVTATGTTVIIALLLLSRSFYGLNLNLIVVIFPGLIIGVAQWVLIRRILHKAWLWPTIQTLGWIFAVVSTVIPTFLYLLIFGFDGAGRNDTPISIAILIGFSFVTPVLVLGAITGTSMRWMIRNSKPNTER